MTRPLFPSNQTFFKSFRGLYRGLGVSIMITTPAVALYLCTYRQAKESLIRHTSLGESTMTYILSGIFAEITSSFMWTPLEVVKARLQISAASTSGSLVSQLREISKAEGIRGFYRGYFMGLGIFMPYNAVWWSSYENSKRVSRNFGIKQAPYQAAIGSALATTLASSLAHPLELVKTRYQVSTSESISNLISSQGTGSPALANRLSDRQGVRHVFRNVLNESGWRGLYAGIGPRLFCSIPGSVISMAVFEYLKPDDNTRDIQTLDSGRKVEIVDGVERGIEEGKVYAE